MCEETIIQMHWEQTKMFKNESGNILDSKIHLTLIAFGHVFTLEWTIIKQYLFFFH